MVHLSHTTDIEDNISNKWKHNRTFTLAPGTSMSNLNCADFGVGNANDVNGGVPIFPIYIIDAGGVPIFPIVSNMYEMK